MLPNGICYGIRQLKYLSYYLRLISIDFFVAYTSAKCLQLQILVTILLQVVLSKRVVNLLFITENNVMLYRIVT